MGAVRPNNKAAVAEAYREFSPSTALYQEVDGTDFLTYKSPIDLVVARRYLGIPSAATLTPNLTGHSYDQR